MPARVKETMRALVRQRERRKAAPPAAGKPPLAVVISGAGPVGLRCAIGWHAGLEAMDPPILRGATPHDAHTSRVRASDASVPGQSARCTE